jgi:hypothetical protein
MTFKNGRFRMTNDAGVALDRGAFRLTGDRLVLRSRGYPGYVKHRLRLHDNRVALQQVENRNPIVHGVPDEVFQYIVLGVAPLERVSTPRRPSAPP